MLHESIVEDSLFSYVIHQTCRFASVLTRDTALWQHFHNRLRAYLPEVGYIPQIRSNSRMWNEAAVRRMLQLDWNWTSNSPRPKTQYNLKVPDGDGMVLTARVFQGGRWLLTHSLKVVRIWDLYSGEGVWSGVVLRSRSADTSLEMHIDDSEAPREYVLAVKGNVTDGIEAELDRSRAFLHLQ